MTLQIKNMVCPRCIMSVKDILDRHNLPYHSVELGKVELYNPLSDTQKKQLNQSLEDYGFEILEHQETKLINQVKSYIIDKVHHSYQNTQTNLSSELSKLLHKDYSILSKLFSRIEGITIEQFYLQQRVEKIKELLTYNELKVTEIAHELGYSSVAHLSTQFKKITGMSPSAFKKLHHKPRKSLDSF